MSMMMMDQKARTESQQLEGRTQLIPLVMSQEMETQMAQVIKPQEAKMALALRVDQMRVVINQEKKEVTRELSQEMQQVAVPMEVLEAVKLSRVVCVVGDTGCGKSTQLPQYISYHFSTGSCSQKPNSQPKVLVTQPRRVAGSDNSRRAHSVHGWMRWTRLKTRASCRGLGMGWERKRYTVIPTVRIRWREHGRETAA
jgi:HrpA-like RNA helicase